MTLGWRLRMHRDSGLVRHVWEIPVYDPDRTAKRLVAFRSPGEAPDVEKAPESAPWGRPGAFFDSTPERSPLDTRPNSG